MVRLLESDELYIYQDKETGRRFIFDGKKLVELPDNKQSDDNPPYHLEKEDGEDDFEYDNMTQDNKSGSDNNDSSEKDSEENDDNSQGENDSSNDSEDELEDDDKNSSTDSKNDSDQEDNSQNKNSDDEKLSEKSSNDNESSDETAGNESDKTSDEENSNSESDQKSSKSDSSDDEGNADNESSSDESSENSKSNSSSEESDEKTQEEINKDIEDIDWDNIDWDELKDEVDEILENIDNLSEEDKQKFYDELQNHLNEVDEEVLEKEEQERQAQIEKELEEYNPEEEDSETRLVEIANDLHNQNVIDDLLDETDRHVYQDRAKRRAEKKRAEAEANKYSASAGIKDFVLDLNRLIAKEVKKVNSSSWGRINKKMDGTGVIKPGKTKKKNPNVPKLFVYFDQSGSWNQGDIQVGIQAIETLNTYVEKKQLKIELYYFADSIHGDPQSARDEGGTGAGRELIEHIATNRPDNVLVMTDSDFDFYEEMKSAPSVTVPGGVFLLFRRNKVSRELINKLHGKQLTKIYSF